MESSKRKPGYGALVGLSGLFTVAGILTLVPSPDASWENVLGYKSLCTFAPMATALCALLAAATCTLRARLLGPRAGERRPWFAPIAVALVLLGVVAAFSPAYVQAKVDASSGASATTD